VTDDELQIAFDQNKDTVFRFVWRLTNSVSVAEDITQDVFLSLLRRPDCFDPARGPLRAFLLGIARNLVLKQWRDQNRWQELEPDQWVLQPIDLERREIAELVAEAVRSLPSLQREVLILAEYEELSLADIARIVEAEVNTVKARLHRARENLRRRLAPLRQSKSNEVDTSWTP
jgi:RNA polymerase sigma-70 factor (ECF subfamily)